MHFLDEVHSLVALEVACWSRYFSYMSTAFEITPQTRIIELLDRYGDIADVMEVFGVHRAGPLALRRVLGRVLTVRMAAWIHGVPLDEMLAKLRAATTRVDAERALGR